MIYALIIAGWIGCGVLAYLMYRKAERMRMESWFGVHTHTWTVGDRRFIMAISVLGPVAALVCGWLLFLAWIFDSDESDRPASW